MLRVLKVMKVWELILGIGWSVFLILYLTGVFEMDKPMIVILFIICILDRTSNFIKG